jgi:hypothetical protein
MESLRNRLFVIVVFALAAIFASAVPASAQSALKGSFTLAHQIRWCTATLPAGNYTFEMKSLADPTLILKGPHGYQFIPALVADEKAIDKSMLIVENHGNESFVRELRVAPIGRSLRYSMPKASKDVELAQGPGTREQIIVATNVK